MDVKGEILLQRFYKRKLRNGTKTNLEPKFFSILVKFKKLEFSAPLMLFHTLRPNILPIVVAQPDERHANRQNSFCV